MHQSVSQPSMYTAASRSRSINILVVDDEPSFCTVLSEILRSFGYIVRQAHDAHHAIELLKKATPDLILTDVMMPGMDGLELIRNLRKEITTAFIPVIVLSAKNSTADRLKGFAVGTDDYLPKPFSIHELFFRVNAILRRVYK